MMDRMLRFYDNSILPGTKTGARVLMRMKKFYDNSILPGTKTAASMVPIFSSFTITQFFQVLKL